MEVGVGLDEGVEIVGERVLRVAVHMVNTNYSQVQLNA